jgi:hypothetical protein
MHAALRAAFPIRRSKSGDFARVARSSYIRRLSALEGGLMMTDEEDDPEVDESATAR